MSSDLSGALPIESTAATVSLPDEAALMAEFESGRPVGQSARQYVQQVRDELKRRHLGLDEATDVLSFPIDGRDELPAGIPRVLGDVVLCPQVVGDGWRAALVHGLLHLLGYEHGDEMEARERALGP